MINDMKDNVIKNKSFYFAVRIDFTLVWVK